MCAHMHTHTHTHTHTLLWLINQPISCTVHIRSPRPSPPHPYALLEGHTYRGASYHGIKLDAVGQQISTVTNSIVWPQWLIKLNTNCMLKKKTLIAIVIRDKPQNYRNQRMLYSVLTNLCTCRHTAEVHTAVGGEPSAVQEGDAAVDPFFPVVVKAAHIHVVRSLSLNRVLYSIEQLNMITATCTGGRIAKWRNCGQLSCLFRWWVLFVDL